MKRTILLCALLSTFVSLGLNAQINQNVTLFGQLDPQPIRYSGCFGYIDSLGAEYALLGAHDHLFAISIDDSTNIYAIDSIAGPGSNWREIAVIGHFAYVVTEGSGTGEGMQVVDLSYLPDSLHLVTTFDSTFIRGHMVQKNFAYDSTFIYVAGSTPGGGVHIIDISNPAIPVEISRYEPYYIHDIHVKGDLMFAAAIFNGTLDVVDISNRLNPVLLEQIIYPSAFTHSSFTTEDNKYLIVTDEIDGLPARIWNIEDLNNINEVSQYTGNVLSLVHNPYIKGDFAYVSHNTEGLRVIDISKPDVPVEVGYYDTYTGPSGGFSGLWSAYPFYPSNKIIGGNREDGLYVWQFDNTYAGRFYGLVVDSLTGQPIINASVQISGTSNSTQSDLTGSFKFGALESGPAGYTLDVTAAGFIAKQYPNIVLNASDSIYLLVELTSITSTIDEITNNILLPFYNRETGRITFDFTLYKDQNITIELYDYSGKLCFTRHTTGGNIFDVKVASLAKGTYLYRILDSNINLLKSDKLSIY